MVGTDFIILFLVLSCVVVGCTKRRPGEFQVEPAGDLGDFRHVAGDAIPAAAISSKNPSKPPASSG